MNVVRTPPLQESTRGAPPPIPKRLLAARVFAVTPRTHAAGVQRRPRAAALASRGRRQARGRATPDGG